MDTRTWVQGWSRGGAVLVAPPAPPPRTLGDYELLQLLGNGGMGSVWLARSAGLGREVALKVLHPPQAPDDVPRFRAEARALARLRHPHILPVYEVGEDQGRWFMALELVRGGSLADRLQAHGPLEPRQAVRIAACMAGALHRAHELGLLHRDVKPENVLLAPGGRPLLGDFGLVKDLRAPGPSPTRSGEVMGTPAYMSPEQARGQPLDRRCDVYGLGATLYELLTGRRPFTGSPVDILAALLREPPTRPSALRPDLDPGLEELVLRCLAKPREDRPASAAQLQRELERWLAGEAPDRRGARRVALRRARLGPLAAVPVVAALGALASAGLLLGSGEPGARSGASGRWAACSALQPGQEGPTPGAAASPGPGSPGAGVDEPGRGQEGRRPPGPGVGPSGPLEDPRPPRGPSDAPGRSGAPSDLPRRRPATPGDPAAGGEETGARRGPADERWGPLALVVASAEVAPAVSHSAGARARPAPAADLVAPEAGPPALSIDPSAVAWVASSAASRAAPTPPPAQPAPAGAAADEEALRRFLAPALDPQGYAWDSYYRANVAPAGRVTGFQALGPKLLVRQQPARIDAIEQPAGAPAPTARVEVGLPGEVTSVTAAGEWAFAAVGDPALDASAAVWERAPDGAWRQALALPRRRALVAALGDVVYAFSGDEDAPLLVHSRAAGGTWTQVAALGRGVPTAAVAWGGRLWLGARTRGGTALLRGAGATWADVEDAVRGDEPEDDERREVTTLLVAGPFLFAGVALTDARGEPLEGRLTWLDDGRLERLGEELDQDAPAALAFQDGTLWVGTRRGRLLYVDRELDDGEVELSLREVSGFPAARGVLSLFTPDARTLLLGVEGPLGGEVVRRVARSP